jgi:hypothetical protein
MVILWNRLLTASVDVASENGTGQVMAGVEMCACPQGYAGTSCEVCIRIVI